MILIFLELASSILMPNLHLEIALEILISLFKANLFGIRMKFASCKKKNRILHFCIAILFFFFVPIFQSDRDDIDHVYRQTNSGHSDEDAAGIHS